MRLNEIMSTPVEIVAAGETADTAWQLMKKAAVHHLVVKDGSDVVGVVSERDLGGRSGASVRRGRAVSDVMTPGAVCAGPTTTVREAANLLRGRGIGCIPVVEKGKLLGIVTISDLLILLGRGAERPVTQAKRWTLKHRGPNGHARRSAELPR